MKLPDGFRPVSLAELLGRNMMTVPRMGKELAKAADPGIDEETELGPGVEMINRLTRAGLVQFAESATGEPAVFTAADSAFELEKDREAADRIVAYFDRSGRYNAETGEMGGPGLAPGTISAWLASNSELLARIAGELHTSKRVVASTLTGWEKGTTTRFHFMTDGSGQRKVALNAGATETERRIWHALVLLVPEAGGVSIGEDEAVERPPAVHHEASYVRAIEAQYRALATLEEAKTKVDRRGITVLAGIPAPQLWGHDIVGLRRAETYCWFPDPFRAVELAAKSLPADTTLRRAMAEEAAGWWYFLERPKVQTTAQHLDTVALLWQWVTRDDRPGQQTLRFSAYVEDEDGTPVPTTLWHWVEGETLVQLHDRIIHEYHTFYERKGIGQVGQVGLEPTLTASMYFAQLWAAGMAWVRQRILVYGHGHVERHDRKRMEREGFHRPLGDVQVIELRRREVVGPSDGHRTVDWSCRWVVNGFWRNQYHPSTGRHELKWIEPYIKGPADRPLKVPTHTVYTVRR